MQIFTVVSLGNYILDVFVSLLSMLAIIKQLLNDISEVVDASFKDLKLQHVTDCFPGLNVSDFSTRLHAYMVLFMLDLVKDYYHVIRVIFV